MIEAKVIVELAGKPKAHIEKTFTLVITEIKKHHEVLDQEIMPVEEKEGVFSTFAELDIKFKDMIEIYSFCANFLPSSIDILSPETVNIDSKELTEFIDWIRDKAGMSGFYIPTPEEYLINRFNIDKQLENPFLK